MSYTPPTSIFDVNWKPSNTYAVTTNINERSRQYPQPHGKSVDIIFDEAANISKDVNFVINPLGYTCRAHNDIRLELVEILSFPQAAIVLELGKSDVVVPLVNVLAAGVFRLEGSGQVKARVDITLTGSIKIQAALGVSYLGTVFEVLGATGEMLSLSLVNDIRFVPEFATGESSTTAMSLEMRLPHAYIMSESMSVGISNTRTVAADFMSSESMTTDLTIQATTILIGVGEDLDVSLDTYTLVGNSNYHGETLTSILATSAVLSPVMGHGESVNTLLTSFPAIFFTMDFSHGEYSDVIADWHATSYLSLSSSEGQAFTLGDLIVTKTAAISAFTYLGESLDTVLTLPTRSDMYSYSHHGESYSMSLSTAIQLGVMENVHGESLSLTLGEAEVYRSAVGESLSSTLTPTVALATNNFVGEYVQTVLDVRPGVGMSVVFGVGEFSTAYELKTQERIYLEVVFYEGLMLQCADEQSTWDYDLELPCCGPEVGKVLTDGAILELEGELPATMRLPNAIVVSCELSARPRFSMQFGVGEHFTAVERNIDFVDLLPIAGNGYIYDNEFLTVYPRTNLCYPNFIPDGNAIDVELEYTDEGCYADYVYHGESLKCELRIEPAMGPYNLSMGENLSCTLTINSPFMSPRFYHGEGFRITPDFEPSAMYDGVAMRCQLEEPSAQAWCSEYMICSLTLTYDVEFLEVGCLDNEYRYMNAYGDEDKAKFNIMAVELEPFFHQIKARCF